jgi:tRNA A-37 threonylcarbamoyl transferase component Bud32
MSGWPWRPRGERRVRIPFLTSFFQIRRQSSATALDWHLHPYTADVLGNGPPPIDEWVASGVAEPVKANDQRTVYRVLLPTGPVYVKRCRVHRPRAWLRELVRPPKAKLEFDHAVSLTARGLETIQPLAWGRLPGRWPSESWLVTRGREAISLSDWLARPMSPRVRRHFASTFAGFVAHLHDAGVVHPDPHPGNLLVETGPDGSLQFVLVDLHAVRPGPPAGGARSMANLVLFNRWFQLRASRTDRLRFWQAYRAARTAIPALDRFEAKRIETKTGRSNVTFWNRRFGRYVTDNREYVRVKGPAAAGYAVRTLPKTFVDSFLADPDGAFHQPWVTVFKDSRTSTVMESRIDTPTGPVPVFIKRFNRKSFGNVLKNAIRRSPATRSWLLGHNLRDRGLPTPKPLLLAHRYRLGVPVVSYLVVEKVPVAVGLPEAVAAVAEQAPNARRRFVCTLAADLGRLVRTLHARGVSHRDLKAPNILLADTHTPTLIDLVGVRTSRAVSVVVRVRDLARLNASFLSSPVVSRTDRLRLLTAYLAAPPQMGRSWKAWWCTVARATREKVAKNARTGRPLA